jgi:hypothetical protein
MVMPGEAVQYLMPGEETIPEDQIWRSYMFDRRNVLPKIFVGDGAL